MSIDLSQFHQVFFEESYEGLQIMETGLLELDCADPDEELINAIFRAAHSIKGGAGTFGFSSVADFTHVMETLLDEVRDGTRQLQQQMIDLFLVSVDCLKGMFDHLSSGSEPDLHQSKDLIAKFESFLASDGSTPVAAATEIVAAPTLDTASQPTPSSATKEGLNQQGWHIYFKPSIDMLKTGNEPLRMIRELDLLDELGELRVVADCDEIPHFDSLEPEECYVAWNIDILGGNIQKDDISEIFEWVVDDCQLLIEAIESKADTPVKAPEDSVAEAPAASKEQAAAVSTDKPAKATPAPKPKKAAAKPATESTSIRVSIDKVDSLINMVGELVITQSMLGELGREFEMSNMQRLQEGLGQLEQNTRELQESVMKIRMMPISFVFSRFPRLVRDLGQNLNKDIELVLVGENTELDKTVMEKIGDPLVHLVRNSIDHGIESKDERVANGKSEKGTITLNAFHQGGNIMIKIDDDGAGLNTQKIYEKALEKELITEDDKLTDSQINDLIFRPGFSTAEVVSDISGRGVGMDVVRRNIQELNGAIEVQSRPGEGSTFTIRLPLTLAILDGQLVSVGDSTYIFPLVSIVESIQMKKDMLSNVGGDNDVLKIRDEYVPIAHLQDILGIENEGYDNTNSLVVIVESDGRKYGVVVDELLGQQQVVIKSMEQNYKKVEGISGATILGDGTVALIIDIAGLPKMGSSPKGSKTKIKAA